jgi:hypothetical protein
MKIGGKEISKFWTIISSLLLIGTVLYYIIAAKRLPTSDEAKALVFIGSGIILFNSPYFISIWIDKFVKKGGDE